MIGTYLLQGNTVTAVFKRKAMEVASSVPNSRFKRKKDDNNNSGSTVVEHVFHLELEIISKKNRLNQTLNWLNFSVDTVYRNGMKSTSEFEVQSLIRFPPFWFSAVRSYNTESTNPLWLINWYLFICAYVRYCSTHTHTHTPLLWSISIACNDDFAIIYWISSLTTIYFFSKIRGMVGGGNVIVDESLKIFEICRLMVLVSCMIKIIHLY